MSRTFTQPAQIAMTCRMITVVTATGRIRIARSAIAQRTIASLLSMMKDTDLNRKILNHHFEETTMAKRKKAEDVEQGHLDGMEPPRIKAIDQAAKVYHNAKKERMALSEEEDQAKDNLIDKMKEHDLQYYETPDGVIVTLTATSNVKTKVKHREEDGGDESGEE